MFRKVISALLALSAAASLAVISASAEYTKGDVDNSGKVDIEDVANLMNHINGVRRLSSTAEKNADMNSDNKVDIEDAVTIINTINGVYSSSTEHSDECAILTSMYKKGYVPRGTYEGSYIADDPEYGLIFVFKGSNRNGGSGTSYSAPYDYTEDSLLDSPSMKELKSLAYEFWDNGAVSDIMGGTNIHSYDFGYAYFIAAVMSGDYQYSGAILAPVI